MAKLSKARAFGYFAMLLNAVFWGMALPIVKKGFDQGLTPSSFLLNRFLFASLLSLPIFFLQKNSPKARLTLRLPSILKISLLEILGNVIVLLLLYEGLKLTTGIEASVIASTWPIFVTLGGIYFLKEKETKSEWKGLVLAFVGTIFLVIRPLFNGHLQGSSLTGNFLVFIQNLVATAYFLIIKTQYKNLNQWLVAIISFWICFFSFAAINLYLGTSPILAITGFFSLGFWPVFATLYMATFGSIIALSLQFIGLSKIEASEASLFTYLHPLFSLPLAVILLGETVNLLEVIAMATIFFGVVFAQRR